MCAYKHAPVSRLQDMLALTVPSVWQLHSVHPVMGSYPKVFSSHIEHSLPSVPVTCGAQMQSPVSSLHLCAKNKDR